MLSAAPNFVSAKRNQSAGNVTRQIKLWCAAGKATRPTFEDGRGGLEIKRVPDYHFLAAARKSRRNVRWVTK
jgi:hypothetical protein